MDAEHVRSLIRNAKNPIIFFDDDADGIASFLLTQRVLGNTLYAPVKKRENIGEVLAKLADDLGADLTIMLDVAQIDDGFFSQPREIVWIDHHEPIERTDVVHYNPKRDGEDAPPTSVLVYELLGGPEWIAAVGSVADYHVPPFIENVREQYPQLVPSFERVEDLIFSSPLGELSRLFEACVKGTVRDARSKLDMLRRITSPEELLEGTSLPGEHIRAAYLSDRERYDRFLAEALEQVTDEKLFVYRYAHGGRTFTAELGNELAYRMPERIIIVASEYAGAYRLSMRSQTIELPQLLERALIGIDGGGGGHPHACGAHVATEDFERFLENLTRELES